MWQYCQNVRAIIWYDGIVLTLHGKDQSALALPDEEKRKQETESLQWDCWIF